MASTAGLPLNLSVLFHFLKVVRRCPNTVFGLVERMEAPSTAPVFLRETHSMIDSCNPDIACWSASGAVIVIKDPERFANEVIPEFFKHNNFSSLVRQLNFYGFRKVKSDPLRLRDGQTNDESKFWKFHHPNFKRGRPDLLGKIRKSGHQEVVDKHELDSLRTEVGDLTDRVRTMTQEISQLRAVVEAVMSIPGIQNWFLYDGQRQEEINKRRKLSNDQAQQIKSSCSRISPAQVLSTVEPMPVAASREASSLRPGHSQPQDAPARRNFPNEYEPLDPNWEKEQFLGDIPFQF